MVMSPPGQPEARPWWEVQDPAQVAGPNGLDPIDLSPPTPATSGSPSDAYAPRQDPPKTEFKPIEPDYRWDMPAVLKQLRNEIPTVPRSSGFFDRMAGSLFDITGDLVGTAMDVMSWPADTTERVAGLFYWNDIPLGDRWQMGKLTWEAAGFGINSQREEILQRYRSGENIGTIAEDYKDDWSNIFTQLLADPLNLLGVPGLGLLADVTRVDKASRVGRTLVRLNKGLVAPRFELKALQTADIVDNVKGSRPASGFLTRAVRSVGLNETADERSAKTLIKTVQDARSWGVNPEDARPLLTDWRLGGTGNGWNLARLTSTARATDTKRSADELVSRLVFDPRLTHSDLLHYQDEIIGNVWNGDLIKSRPDWLVPGTMRDTPLPDLVARVTTGIHPNPPQGLAVMEAANAEARGQGIGVDTIFRKSRARGWFDGTPEEYAALSRAEQVTMYSNREKWNGVFLDEWQKFMKGDHRMAGAIDHYYGLGADVHETADGLVVVPREMTELEKFDRKMQAWQGHLKGALSIAFLNKPAYVVANAVTALSFGIFRIGQAGVWRNNAVDEARIGTDLARMFAYDFGRSGYQAIKEASQGPVSVKTALKGSLLTSRPFTELANKLPHVADVDIRRRLLVEHYHNIFTLAGVPQDLSDFGIYKAIRWADGTPPDEQRAVISMLGNVRNEAELDAKIKELGDGTLSLDHAGYLLQRVLEADGEGQAKAALYRNMMGEKHFREMGDALAKAKTPEEATHIVDQTSSELAQLSYEFGKDIPLPIYRAGDATLRELRAQNSVVIRRWFEGLNAATQRAMDIHGVRDPRVEAALHNVTKTLEDGQLKMFTRLDGEMSPFAGAHDLTTAAGRKAYRDLRNSIVREYYDTQTATWKAADGAIRPAMTKPELRTWWADFRQRQRLADIAVRDKLNAVFKSLGEDWSYISEAGPEWRSYAAFKDATYQKLLDETYQGLGLKQLPSQMDPIMQEGIDVAHGMQRYADETKSYLKKMGEHVNELFDPVRREGDQVVEWAPKRFVIDAERAAEYRRYLHEDVRPDLRLLQSVALRSGRAYADDALLAYDTKYGFDKALTYMFPYMFWPSRMPYRWMRAAQARPAYAASFAKLIEFQRQMQADLPDQIRNRLRIPVPFLPDWMGDSLYFDPIRYFFPPGESFGQDVEGDNTFSKVLNWAQNVGAMPTPVVSLPLQMTGVLGERDSYIRYFMSGGPWLIPGTAGQQALWSFTHGAPSGDWTGDLKPEDWNAIALGEALPEPRIREILGIPPGDAWDGYRVLRAIASGTADGSWTAEQAVKAMQSRSGPIWEQGKDRAGKESAVRGLTNWLGAPVSVYPEGQRIQDGLQAMYAVARDLDRAAGTDNATKAFFDSYPEFQTRSIQKAWYRGTPAVEAEADTAAYYIDLGQVKDQYDPQIAYLTQVRNSMPKGLRGPWQTQLSALYDERQQKLDALDLKYPRRRTTPALAAAPHDRALAYLREQYYKIKGADFATKQAARDMFLSKLTGRGMADNYYRLTIRRDELFAQYSQKLADTPLDSRDAVYQERQRALEQLTQQAIPDISRQDFLDYLAKSKNAPTDEIAMRQRQSDLLAMVFSSSDGQRVLSAHPEIAQQYGTAADPVAAGKIDAWYNWYDALPVNSRARDDYVQSTLPQLNEWRARLGLAPLAPRPRPEAGPIVTGGDPYEQAIAAAEVGMQ